MRLTRISIKNYKALRDIDIPLSRFACIIGENNAGKSSLLQAARLFVEGTKVDHNSFFDVTLPITISVRIESITETDLSRIENDEHRNRFAEILSDGAVTLVRRYETTGSARLRWVARVPSDARFDETAIETLLGGKKPGSEFAELLTSTFPEIAGQFDSKTNQRQARAMISDFSVTIPDSQRYDCEMDLKSGIDNSIRPLMPEVIFIPAVKDLADETATKDSASFGKLLGILLGQIASKLEDALYANY
jgi:putative ATP-dependent endonuclease of the OLD family